MRTFHHVCIQTDTYEASKNFYTRILEFKVVHEKALFHGRAFNTWLKQGEFMIELQTPKAGEILKKWSPQNGGPVHLGFLVEDAHREYERIKSLGYTDFKVKDGKEFYAVCGKGLFKVKAPEGTEIEFRDTEINK